jgi:tetratricopeptide (TPR) repeat protein
MLSDVTQRKAAILILLATIAAYLPALSAGFIWDDDSYLTTNPVIIQPGGFHKIWLDHTATPQYYPLVFTSFYIEHMLWGLSPIGYHLVNILLHAINAILVYHILKKLSVSAALAAALVFALHPVHVESVAWITERKNVLSALFYLASLSCYLRYDSPQSDAAPSSRPQTRAYGLSLLLYLCALLCKSVTATLPAAILVILWWRRGKLTARDFLRMTPYFIVGILAGLHTAWIEHHHVGTGRVDIGISGIDRLLVAGRVAWFYLGKLLWPADLIFVYPRWEIDHTQLWQYIFPLAAIALLVALWRLRHRIGRGPIAAALFFGGTLAPAMGFVDVYPMRFSFVADHFQYLASIGPIVLLTSGCTRFTRSRMSQFTIAPILVLLAVLTWRQCGIYENPMRLWTDTLSKNPGAWMAQGNLATCLFREGKIDEAIELYKENLRLQPLAPEIHYDLARAYVSKKQASLAIEHFKQAIQQNPAIIRARIELAALLLAEKNPEGAIFQFQEILRIDPRHFEAHYNLGSVFANLGRHAEAIEHYRSALQANPRSAETANTLAVLLSSLGRDDDAIKLLQLAIDVRGNYAEAHFNLAHLLEIRGDLRPAEEHYRSASQLNPRDVQSLVAIERVRKLMHQSTTSPSTAPSP